MGTGQGAGFPARLEVSARVQRALKEGAPVVALESAVLTHGLPHPRNLEAVEQMEAAIRETGAVPATCLVEEGRLVVGADLPQAHRVSAAETREKASVRDLGRIVAQRRTAGLTVSATLFVAHLAGIKVFATGGIGGVHLDFGDSGDASTDLLQLARSPVITVCAGAKSVLDLPRTLEILESYGVPVYGYQSNAFPAFYLTSSGLPIPRLDTPESVADVARAQWSLGYQSGIVVGNPLSPSDAISEEEWRSWLEPAQEALRSTGIRGKEVTPFLLDQVARASRGRTVRANVALLVSNARLAALVAGALVA